MKLNETTGLTQSLPERVVKKYDKDGNISQISIFKDVNGDGKEDLYQVTQYYRIDGTTTVQTYTDYDGDGYDDNIITKEYDKNNKLTEERKVKEEDIKSVKNRNHWPWEINNRRMDVHESGNYIF